MLKIIMIVLGLLQRWFPDLVPVIRAIQEQQEIIEEQQNQINELKSLFLNRPENYQYFKY